MYDDDNINYTPPPFFGKPTNSEDILNEEALTRLAVVQALGHVFEEFENKEEWLGYVDRVVEYIKTGKR